MMGKNVAARIVKLEARRQRPNEILLVWRRPDTDVRSATSGTKFASGDRVICVEWFGEGVAPAPRWYRQRISSELGAVESEYLTRSLNRVAEGDLPRDPGFAEFPVVSTNPARDLADNDLLHMVFGVAT